MCVPDIMRLGKAGNIIAQSHNAVFNTIKSQCMIIDSKCKCKVLRSPSFRLCLLYADKYKYLGHVICADLTYDADVMKQTTREKVNQ